MKKLNTIIGCLLLSVAAQQIYAQEGAAQSAGPRDLYNTYGKSESAMSPVAAAANKPPTGRPGVRVRVELDRGGRVRWVSSKTIFQAGDKVRFHFAMNFSGYVVIINEGSSGRRSLLFPYEGVSNHIGRTADYTVPQGEAWFEFDKTAGEEHLTFIMSKREIQEVTQITVGNAGTQAPAANTSNSNSSAQVHPPKPPPSTPAANPSPANVPRQTEEQEILAALNSRAITFGRDLKLVDDSNDSYVLATDEALAKPMGFKLTLKHR
jgi:hypothetical protein